VPGFGNSCRARFDRPRPLHGLSWTIVVTRPDGMSSVVAPGEAWSFIGTRKGMPI